MATEPTPSEINELKKRLEDDSDSLVFAALADAYRKQGKLPEALEVCKKGLEQNPTYTSAHVVLGRIYREQGKIDEAVSEFRLVLDLDPENLISHSMLGSIFAGRDDYQSAIEEYQTILTLNPDDEDTQASLRQAIEKAAGDSKRSGAAKPQEPPAEKKPVVRESTATLTIAELYSKQGHLDKAVEVYQDLLADDPHNLMLRQKLNEVMQRQPARAVPETGASKLMKSEFTRPPDQKEDTIPDESKLPLKKPLKLKRENDSKFTSDDILQVMRGGGKDDVVVEEKKTVPPAEAEPAPPAPAREETVTPGPPAPVEVPAPSNDPVMNRTGALKGILADLKSVEGLIRCTFIEKDGRIAASTGESDGDADLGKQAQAIFQSTQRSVAQLEQGTLHQVLVTAVTGHILLVSFGAFLLIVIADKTTNLGLLRLALESAMKKLDKIS